MMELTEETELQEILQAARQALDGVVAMEEEDAGPNGESLTCAEIVDRIDRYLLNEGRGNA